MPLIDGYFTNSVSSNFAKTKVHSNFYQIHFFAILKNINPLKTPSKFATEDILSLLLLFVVVVVVLLLVLLFSEKIRLDISCES